MSDSKQKEAQERLGDKMYVYVSWRGETQVFNWDELYNGVIKLQTGFKYFNGDLAEYIDEWFKKNNVKIVPLSCPTAEDAKEFAENVITSGLYRK